MTKLLQEAFKPVFYHVSVIAAGVMFATVGAADAQYRDCTNTVTLFSTRR